MLAAVPRQILSFTYESDSKTLCVVYRHVYIHSVGALSLETLHIPPYFFCDPKLGPVINIITKWDNINPTGQAHTTSGLKLRFPVMWLPEGHTYGNTQTKGNLEKFVFQIDLAEDRTRYLIVVAVVTSHKTTEVFCILLSKLWTKMNYVIYLYGIWQRKS